MMLKTPLDSIDWCAWFGGGWVGCMMWKVWKLYQGHSDFAPSTNLPVLTASAVLLLPVLLSACVLQEVLFRAAAWTALTRAGYWLPARMLGPKYQIPHLQVAPNLPSGVTKKVHNMPTSKSINIDWMIFKRLSSKARSSVWYSVSNAEGMEGKCLL